jgi:LysR family transcriptional regulator, transcriptional activator for dmlA
MPTAKYRLDRIQDLQTFIEVIEHGSMTAAGIALGISTPLVSRRLAGLERRLGTRLIDRTSRMIIATSQGREFFSRAASLLEQLREAEEAMQATQHELRGTLRISVPTAAVEMGLIADLGRLSAKHSRLNVEIHLSDRPVDVISRGLDAALFLTDAPDRHPGDLILGKHPTSLAAAPGYLNSTGRPVAPEGLLAHRTIRVVSRRGTPSPWTLIGPSGTEVQVPPTGQMMLSDDQRVTYTAILNGDGIGRMPLCSIAKGATNGSLELVLPEWRFRPIMIAATLRRRDSGSGMIRSVLELVSTALGRMESLYEGSPLESYCRQAVRELCDEQSTQWPARSTRL